MENIHPFSDGNGRLGRLLMNYILVWHNHPPVIVFAQDRKEYYAALEAWDSCQDLQPLQRFCVGRRRRPGKESWRKMIKVLFVCHGNICRSPMAEFLLKDMVGRQGRQGEFEIASAATSREEIGNPVHYGTRNKLAKLGISVAGKTARQMTRQDYEYYDYVIAMDRQNLRNIERIIDVDDLHKVHLLLDYAGRKGESIADPWYTGDFDVTYEDIMQGLAGFLDFVDKAR